MFEFVGDRHLLRGMFSRLPAGGKLEFDIFQAGMSFLRSHGRIQHIDQAAHNVLLFAQDGATGRLGRMRGKDRLDAYHIEQLLQRRQIHAGCLEPDQGLFETAGLILTDFLQVFAPPPDAMHFLGGIHHLKVGRERTDHFERELQIQIFDKSGELFTRYFVILAPANRPEPRRLDQVEQRLTALVPQQFTHHVAEYAHIVTQRLVLVLEDDVLSAQCFLHDPAS